MAMGFDFAPPAVAVAVVEELREKAEDMEDWEGDDSTLVID